MDQDPYEFINALRELLGLKSLSRAPEPKKRSYPEFPEPGWVVVDGGRRRTKSM